MLEAITSDAANEESSKKKREGQIQQLLLKIPLTEKITLGKCHIWDQPNNSNFGQQAIDGELRWPTVETACQE